MKAILTLLFVLFIGIGAQAQDVKVKAIERGIETEITVKDQEMAAEKTSEVARLYRRSNSRVKKALSFTTKRNRAKTA